MKKFFDYIQLPNFDIAADAAATFKVSAPDESANLEETMFLACVLFFLQI